MTLQELEHYFAQGTAYRNTVPEPDVSLAQIRAALFAFFGIKEPALDREARLDEELKAVKAPRVTKEESEAWWAAGMPSPMGAWIRSYRERRGSGSQAQGGPS